jgi:hypothetical protein
VRRAERSLCRAEQTSCVAERSSCGAERSLCRAEQSLCRAERSSCGAEQSLCRAERSPRRAARASCMAQRLGRIPDPRPSSAGRACPRCRGREGARLGPPSGGCGGAAAPCIRRWRRQGVAEHGRDLVVPRGDGAADAGGRGSWAGRAAGRVAGAPIRVGTADARGSAAPAFPKPTALTGGPQVPSGWRDTVEFRAEVVEAPDGGSTSRGSARAPKHGTGRPLDVPPDVALLIRCDVTCLEIDPVSKFFPCVTLQSVVCCLDPKRDRHELSEVVLPVRGGGWYS